MGGRTGKLPGTAWYLPIPEPVGSPATLLLAAVVSLNSRSRFRIQFRIVPCQPAGNPCIRNREPCTPAPPPS